MTDLTALARSATVRGSRPTRLAAGGAAIGMALLALLELIAIAAWRAETTSWLATAVTNAYGRPVTLLGVALTVLGGLLLRIRSQAGRCPVAWAVLALGL